MERKVIFWGTVIDSETWTKRKVLMAKYGANGEQLRSALDSIEEIDSDTKEQILDILYANCSQLSELVIKGGYANLSGQIETDLSRFNPSQALMEVLKKEIAVNRSFGAALNKGLIDTSMINMPRNKTIIFVTEGAAEKMFFERNGFGFLKRDGTTLSGRDLELALSARTKNEMQERNIPRVIGAGSLARIAANTVAEQVGQGTRNDILRHYR